MTPSPPAARGEKLLHEFDAFRVDPVRRRLFRDGELVALTPKAFSILLVLLENRGDVVEKEELIRRVWGDTYVTEANLTQNISSLRKALGERANDHRFVVTVPGLGYSFVAEVRDVLRDPTVEMPFAEAVPSPATGATPLPGTGTLDLPEISQPMAAPSAASLPPAASRFKGKRRFLFAGLVLGFLLALGLLAFINRERDVEEAETTATPSAGPAAEAREGAVSAGFRPSVAVLKLRNLKQNRQQEWLATALAEMLTTELSAGSKVRMVSGEEIARARQSLALPYAEDLGEANLRQVHETLGADFLVVGSFLTLEDEAGAKIRIDLRVVRAPEGDTVASVSEVGTEENLFELISVIGSRLRQGLKWTPPSPEEKLAAKALQPGNTEAARHYNEGLTRLRAYDAVGARDHLLRAVKADPQSAVIHASLSQAWSGLGHEAEARHEAELAVQLASALPQENQLAIRAGLSEAQKDWTKASEIYRSLWTFYPDNLDYGLGLANNLLAAGRIADSLATVASLRQLPEPARGDPRIDLVAAQLARQKGDPGEELRLGRVAAQKGQQLGQTQVVAEALLLQGGALFIMGRPDESIERFNRAEELFAAAGNQAARARTLNRIGAVLLDVSDFAGANRRYEEALAIARQLGSTELIAKQKIAMAFAAADLGDLERSRALAEEVYGDFVTQGDLLYQARSLYKLAEILWEMGEIEKSRQTYGKVLVLSRKGSNQVEEMRALNGLGLAQAAVGSLKEGRRQQELALWMAQASRDPFLTAAYRMSSGETLIAQGDLTMARSRFEQALGGKRQVGDRLGTSQALGLLAGLVRRQGDLGLSRRYATEQKALAEQVQAPLAIARSLVQLGGLARVSGDLSRSREHLSAALRLSESHKATLLATEIRLELARLELLADRPAEALRLAQEAAQWYAPRGLRIGQARALALKSRALLTAGRPAEAREAAEQAHSISAQSEDLELQIEVVTAMAPPILAAGAAGAQKAALGHLRWAIEESARIGDVASGFEAKLTLGALEMTQGDALGGRKLLTEVRRDAGTRGFQDIVRRTDRALASQSVPLG